MSDYSASQPNPDSTHPDPAAAYNEGVTRITEGILEGHQVLTIEEIVSLPWLQGTTDITESAVGSPDDRGQSLLDFLEGSGHVSPFSPPAHEHESPPWNVQYGSAGTTIRLLTTTYHDLKQYIRSCLDCIDVLQSLDPETGFLRVSAQLAGMGQAAFFLVKSELFEGARRARITSRDYHNINAPVFAQQIQKWGLYNTTIVRVSPGMSFSQQVEATTNVSWRVENVLAHNINLPSLSTDSVDPLLSDWEAPDWAMFWSEARTIVSVDSQILAAKSNPMNSQPSMQSPNDWVLESMRELRDDPCSL